MKTRVACLHCNLCAHVFCSRNKKQFAHELTQLKRHVWQSPASLMVYLAFTHSALALSFNIDTLFLINLQNKSALFCSIKSVHLHALV